MAFATSMLLSVALVAASSVDERGLLRLCLEDQTDLPKVARIELEAELNALLDSTNLELVSGPCPSPGADSVRIRLDARPDGMPSDVLGAARLEGERVAPDLIVFPREIQRFTGANDCERWGRAIARVAAHEIAHYLRQSLRHEEQGLMREAFSPTQLSAAAHRPTFRLASNFR